MIDSPRSITIVGGHGKVALRAATLLADEGCDVTSIIRNPDHADEVKVTGAGPLVCDIEQAETGTLAELFEGADAIVFSAGAGGGNPERTRAVDFEAAVRTMDAAAQAGVPRYVMVSYARAATDVDTLDTSLPFYHYARAKHDADEYLRGTDLDYTILGPGSLTLEKGTGRIQLVDDYGESTERELGDDERKVSRDNVAAAIAHVLFHETLVRQTRNFVDGDVPIAEALA